MVETHVEAVTTLVELYIDNKQNYIIKRLCSKPDTSSETVVYSFYSHEFKQAAVSVVVEMLRYYLLQSCK